jgi:hypothetical protein
MLRHGRLIQTVPLPGIDRVNAEVAVPDNRGAIIRGPL